MERYEVYKDSRVEWLGEIPAEWEVKKLKYEVQVNPLKDNLDQTSDELVTFLPMDSISENGEADCSIKKPVSSVCNGFTFFRKNDVIVAKITPCFENGKCVILSDLDTSIGFGSTEFHVLRPKERIVGKFLYYITKSEIFMQSGEAFMYGAAGQKRVPSGFISDFPLVLPNVDEQTTIANFLDRKTAEIDALIAQKERLLELYEEEKSAIINHAVTKGLDPNAELKDSGVEWLGEIPVGWEIKKLKYGVSKVGSGVTPRGGASIYQLSGIPLLRSQNIHVDGIKMDDVAYIDEELHDSMSNSKVQAGDVLLNITGASIGRCFYVEENFGEANVNQHVCIIRPNGKIKTSYLYFVLRSDLGEEQIKIEQTGSGREGLNFEALNNFIIPYLSVEEQTAIANFLDRKMTEIDTKIAKTQRIIELQKEYRTALISDVVTGKIKVSHLAGEEAAR